MVRLWIANPSFPSSNLGAVLLRGRGGMVDTTDLKSVDLNGREGSSPSVPNFILTYRFFKYSVLIPNCLSITIFPVLTISIIP